MRIALFQPDIPQNTGNIIRLATCFNVPVDIIKPMGFFLFDKKFKRSAMDYLNSADITEYSDWNEYKDWYKKEGFRLILLTTKASKKYYDINYEKKDILLFGRETEGVPNKIHDIADERIVIPIDKNLRSLNVSSAAAISLSEALRQLKN